MNKNSETRVYLRWLAKTKLKRIVDKEIKFEELSTWSLNKITHNDLMFKNDWFISLKKKLNKKKINESKKNYILYLVKNLFFQLSFTFIYKFLFKEKNKNRPKENCFFSYYIAMSQFNKKFLDQNFTLTPLNHKKKNSLLISVPYDFKTLLNFKQIIKNLKKNNIEFFFLHNYINLRKIFYVYFKIFFLFLKSITILNKKNYFILNKIDCSSILKNYFLESFSGTIQNFLIEGISVNNFLNKHKHNKFISYNQFLPGSQAIYYFVRKVKYPIKIISLQHMIYFRNDPSQDLKSKGFRIIKNQNKKMFQKFETPDYFLVNGVKYSNFLKKYFNPKKIFIIGSPKFDFIKKFNANKKYLEKPIKFKKILLIISIAGEYEIINFLNKCDLDSTFVILSPHPAFKYSSLNLYKKLAKFKYSYLENYSTRELIFFSDVIIGGISSTMYEAMYYNLNVIRVSDNSFPVLSDTNDNIPMITSPLKFNKYLNNPKKIKKFKINKTINELFYKIDKKTYLRFNNFLNNI